MKPYPHYLDRTVARNTAFGSFAELVGEPVYRPSLDMREQDMRDIADAYDQHMAKAGDPRRAFRYGVNRLIPGQTGRVYANQGRRPARVLAVAEGRALIEYDMPNGRSYLWDVTERTPLSDDTITFRDLRNVSPKRAPKRWQAVLADYV